MMNCTIHTIRYMKFIRFWAQTAGECQSADRQPPRVWVLPVIILPGAMKVEAIYFLPLISFLWTTKYDYSSILFMVKVQKRQRCFPAPRLIRYAAK